MLFTKNLPPDYFGLLLQKCLKTKSLKPCKQIHAKILASGVDMNSLSLHSKLVGVYASCGDLSSAKLMFQVTEHLNVFAYNWMISSLTFTGHYQQAIGYFSRLLESRNLAPNKYTFSFVLKACVGLLDLNMGKKVHGMVNKLAFELDVVVGNGLIDMYCKCGSLCYARKLFDRIPEPDIASWTTMISGYSNVGELQESDSLFNRMKLAGLEPNNFTWNAMIAGYAKSGDCDGAFKLFDRMSREGMVPDLATWNAMISGFVQSQRTIEAVELFRDLLLAGIKPNHVTVTGLLPACGLLGSIHRGREIHGLIYRMGLYINEFVSSALIDMYSKCGCVKGAQNVFGKIPVKNVALWNAMIGCYGKHGMVDSAILLLGRMKDEGVKPNQVTLTCVLSSCSHGGLVEKGLMIFRSMRECNGVEASKEHYACVVDLLCRSGKIEEAYNLVKEMPIQVTDSMIGALFNGCVLHNRRDLAKQMAEDISKMKLTRPGGFVTLSNVYAAGGEWEEVENVRKAMKEQGVHKHPGFSWVDSVSNNLIAKA